ncbi:MFS transporter [Penicillium angulare]|uniref:MFS transporter n=1 Tax=Penicillium angulare TaxID=116970 RepID=A0A9W9FB39_9EURO|nr:MFS transporter [Penicillium angulare]
MHEKDYMTLEVDSTTDSSLNKTTSNPSVRNDDQRTPKIEEPKEQTPTDASTTASEDEKLSEPPLSLWSLVPITAALCASLFCMSLDGTILATAIPEITTQFNSLDDVGWYGSSYMFATCSVQLIYGKLYTFYPSKWVYLIALIIFEVGSVVCATAPNSVALIVGRAVAGLGAAGLFSGALIIINRLVPLRIRPVYLGLVSSMHAIASVAGPILGGVFTDRLTWRWCFYINLPFGGFAVILILLCLPANSSSVIRLSWREQLKQFDLPGFVILAPSVICLVLALQWGGTTYPWNSGRVIALFVVFGVLFIAFLGIQVWQGERATVPPRVIKNRNIWGATWYGGFMGAGMFIVIYYLPIWFQAVKGTSAEQSGIDNLPSLVGMVLFAIIGGVISSTVGYYTPLILISSVITSISAGLLTTLKPNSGIGPWFGYQVLLSAGIGLGAQNMMLVASVAVPKEDMPIATSILTFIQILASAIVLPIGQSVFQNQLVANFNSLLPDVDAAEVVSKGATGFRDLFSSAQLPLALSAYNKALTQTFYVAVATSSLSIIGPIFMEWLSLKKVAAEREQSEEKENDEEKGQAEVAQATDAKSPKGE